MKKALIIIFALILLFSTISYASLSTDLIHVWPLNNTNTSDIVGGYNLTDIGGADQAPAFYPVGTYNRLFNAPNERFYYPDINITDDITISFWLNITLNSTFYVFQPYWNGFYGIVKGNASHLTLSLGGNTAEKTTDNLTRNQYYFFTYYANLTYHKMSINGTVIYENYTASIRDGINGTFAFGDQSGNTPGMVLDEVYIWNRSLTDAEISSLWNSGTGSFYPFPAGSTNIDVTLNSPLNNTWNNSQYIYYQYTPTFNSSQVKGCHLYRNTTGNKMTRVSTNSSPVINNTLNDFHISMGSDGHYLWNIECNTTDGSSTWADYNYTIKIDTVNPILTVNKPINKSYSLTNLTIDIKCTDPYVYYLNYTVYNSSHILNSSQNTTTSGTALTLNDTINISEYAYGLYYINISCSDGHTSSYFEPAKSIDKTDNKLTFNFDTRPFSIEAVSDKISNFTTTKQKDRYTFDLKFTEGVDSFQYIIEADSIVKYNSGIKGHYIINNLYWFDTEPYESITSLDGNRAVITVLLPSKIKEAVSESIGGLNIVETTYLFYVGLYRNIDYTSLVLSTEYNNISIDILNRSGTNNSANLIYNGTLYNSTNEEYNESSGYIRYTFLATAPSTNVTYNASFYMNYTYSDGITGVTDNYTQTVNPIQLSECVGTNTSTLTIYFMEETGLYYINVSAEMNFDIYGVSLGNTTNYPINFSDRYNISLCRTTNTTAQLSGYISYATDNGFTHRYYILNMSISNTTNYLYLYNFNSSSSISTLNGVTRYTTTYNFFPNVYVKLLRYYPATNSWRLVQMDKSDDFGQVVFHVIEQSTDYKFIFEYNYQTLSTTNPMKFICTPDITGARVCSLTFPLSVSTAADTTTFTSDYDYDNETGIITVNFNEASGTPHNVWLTVLQKGTVDTVICNNSAYGVSGSITCNISGYSGTMQVFAYRQTLTLPFIMQWIVVPLLSFYEEAAAYKGDMVFFSAGLIMTTTIAGALITPPAALLGILVGLIGVFTMKTVYLPISIFILAIIIIFIAIPKAR